MFRHQFKVKKMHPLSGTLERHKSKEILNNEYTTEDFKIVSSMEELAMNGDIEDEVDTNLPTLNGDDEVHAKR